MPLNPWNQRGRPHHPGSGKQAANLYKRYQPAALRPPGTAGCEGRRRERHGLAFFGHRPDGFSSRINYAVRWRQCRPPAASGRWSLAISRCMEGKLKHVPPMPAGGCPLDSGRFGWRPWWGLAPSIARRPLPPLPAAGRGGLPHQAAATAFSLSQADTPLPAIQGGHVLEVLAKFERNRLLTGCPLGRARKLHVEGKVLTEPGPEGTLGGSGHSTEFCKCLFSLGCATQKWTSTRFIGKRACI